MNAEDQQLIKKIISQNQRLLQNLNTQRHCKCNDGRSRWDYY